MNIKIRGAIKDDIDGLDKVMRVICDNGANREKTPGLIEQISKDDRKYLMIAESADTKEILGSLYALVFEDICGTAQPILLIENVAVLEKCQGMGVGKKMFEEIEEWGRKFDCHYVMLVSGNDRVGAHKFYEKLGYSEVKGFKKYL